ncbi:acetyl-CoA carboxylase biotin carboxyl carrier protein subunit [Mucilaginibacter sp. E4BP6]|uniref:acetyl-CoA carboxylase biotin carboxyl carrier protein subunit n=1 Tax=Mucilaginibacter sp. E4BP6 TaxID=2723089 RepID=UPI0015CAAC58|nr:acetyl-CoA carboxylase biotin carboxyl carrier protein subunit [Mucilaginibacter sp. E4BP6]NYE64280.1 biotin carboxyl carrier protein [Mucilaginibacter sp. E4BP6]
MIQVKVNHKYNFEIDKNNDEILINGEIVNADIKQINASAYHIIDRLKSYNAEVVSFNVADKTAEIKVNNNLYIISVKDQFDVLLEKLGLNNLNSAKISEVKAPMPGMVLKVFVTEGSEVLKGDNLFILEAMKMENIIKASADVVVKTVKIKPGDKVEKGQVLLLFK